MTVTIYSQPDCYPCKATYKKADQVGLDYSVVDIREDHDARDYVIGLGHLSTPVVVVSHEDGSQTSWAGYIPHKIEALVS